MAWSRTRRRITVVGVDLHDASSRGEPVATLVETRVGVVDLEPPPERRGLRRSPLPTEPFATEELLTAMSCGVERRVLREVSSHEVLRHVHVDPTDALERFAGWWPSSLPVRGGVFEMVDRTTTSIEGHLRRPLSRRLRVDLAVEVHGDGLCAVRLTPELRSRRLAEPTEAWWTTAHDLVDLTVAVVRPRQNLRGPC